MTKQEFLEKANHRSRTRIFDDSDFDNFSAALKAAKGFAKKGQPFFATGNAGSVSKAYRYAADTAQWAVWTAPDGQVVVVVKRGKCSGDHVTHAFTGGEAAHKRWFHRITMELINKITSHTADATSVAEWFHTICANERG